MFERQFDYSFQYQSKWRLIMCIYKRYLPPIYFRARHQTVTNISYIFSFLFYVQSFFNLYTTRYIFNSIFGALSQTRLRVIKSCVLENRLIYTFFQIKFCRLQLSQKTKHYYKYQIPNSAYDKISTFIGQYRKQ